LTKSPKAFVNNGFQDLKIFSKVADYPH